jgi:hypothetical protein
MKQYNVYAVCFAHTVHLSHIFTGTYWQCKQYIRGKNPGGCYFTSLLPIDRATEKYRRLLD